MLSNQSLLATNLILCFLFPSSAAFGKSKSDSTFEKIKPLLFQVKTTTQSTVEKMSYGTGFVVHRKGLLATNFHVVADYVWKPKKFKITVDVDGEDVDGKVLAVDIVNDLALVQINKDFPRTIEFAKGAPAHGEDVLSYGLPEDLNWTVVKGVYNGILKQGPYETIHLSAPLNSGMSGGPTLNRQGELIGINSAGRRFSQEISFAVPAKYLTRLLKLESLKKKESRNLMEDTENQAIELQENLKKLLTEAFSKQKKVSGWNFPQFDKSFRCWGKEADFDPEKDPMKGASEDCQVENSIYIDGERTFGTFEANFDYFKNQSLNVMGWLHTQGLGFGQIPQMVFTRDKDSVINFEKPHCLRENLIAKNKTEKLAFFCLQKISPFKNLFDAYLMLNVPRGSEFLRAHFTLSGFTRENLTTIVEKIIDFNYSPEASHAAN